MSEGGSTSVEEMDEHELRAIDLIAKLHKAKGGEPIDAAFALLAQAMREIAAGRAMVKLAYKLDESEARARRRWGLLLLTKASLDWLNPGESTSVFVAMTPEDVADLTEPGDPWAVTASFDPEWGRIMVTKPSG